MIIAAAKHSLIWLKCLQCFLLVLRTFKNNIILQNFIIGISPIQFLLVLLLLLLKFLYFFPLFLNILFRKTHLLILYLHLQLIYLL